MPLGPQSETLKEQEVLDSEVALYRIGTVQIKHSNVFPLYAKARKRVLAQVELIRSQMRGRGVQGKTCKLGAVLDEGWTPDALNALSAKCDTALAGGGENVLEFDPQDYFVS